MRIAIVDDLAAERALLKDASANPADNGPQPM